MKKIQKFVWFFPFLIFIIGYYSIHWLVKVPSFETPLLIGLSVKDAVVQLSEKKLNIRILTQKEDPDVPEGTVLSQVPRPGQKIKQHQPVFLVLAKEPLKQRAPDCIGLVDEKAVDLIRKESIRVKKFYISSIQKRGTVIGQWPYAGSELEVPFLILYISSGGTPYKIIPDFSGEPVLAVKEFLEQEGVEVSVTYALSKHRNVPLNQCIVKNHKPLAGSLIDSKKPLYMRLNIEKI